MRGRLGGTALCAAYGTVHALVDAVTVSTLFIALSRHGAGPSARWTFVVAYNALAFASQPLFGLVSDAIKLPRLLICAGILLSIAGIFFVDFGLAVCIAAAATGNALFHVGAGALSVLATPGKASGPGIFVAPGALGLALGSYLGSAGIFPVPTFAVLLAFSFAFVVIVRPAKGYARADGAGRAEAEIDLIAKAIPWIGSTLVLAAIVLRAVIGTTSKYGIERGIPSLIVLSLAAAAGKAAGGLAADRFGRLKAIIPALVLSAPLIALSGGNLAFLAAGVFLFQAAMPVTLSALASIMPRLPGFAFGLNCLALFLGFLVTAYPARFAFQNPTAQFISGLAAAAIVSAGLWLMGDGRGLTAPRRGWGRGRNR